MGDKLALTRRIIGPWYGAAPAELKDTILAIARLEHAAREARKAIVGNMDEATARRIIVAGFGDSSPLPGIDPADARNRRVEVQLTLK